MTNCINRDFAIELCRPMKDEEGLPLRILKNIPLERVVSRDAFEQILWEHDVMEEQLHSIGKSLGEKMDDIRKINYGTKYIRYNEKGTCQTCKYCHVLWKDGNVKSLCCDYWEDTYEVNKKNFCDYFEMKDD